VIAAKYSVILVLGSTVTVFLIYATTVMLCNYLFFYPGYTLLYRFIYLFILTKVRLTLARPFGDKFADYFSANGHAFSKVPPFREFFQEFSESLRRFSKESFQETSHLFLLLIMRLENINLLNTELNQSTMHCFH
jgi:hypothetical protein